MRHVPWHCGYSTPTPLTKQSFSAKSSFFEFAVIIVFVFRRRSCFLIFPSSVSHQTLIASDSYLRAMVYPFLYFLIGVVSFAVANDRPRSALDLAFVRDAFILFFIFLSSVLSLFFRHLFSRSRSCAPMLLFRRVCDGNAQGSPTELRATEY